MVVEKLINEAERLLKKYEQIDSISTRSFHDWLKAFIKYKKVNLDNWHQHTLLMATAKSGEMNFARLLLENGALVNCQNVSGNTALIFAVKENNIEMVKLLLSFGADPSIKNYIGIDALFYAKNYSDNKEIFNLLSGNHECEENNLDEEYLKEEVKRFIKM